MSSADKKPFHTGRAYYRERIKPSKTVDADPIRCDVCQLLQFLQDIMDALFSMMTMERGQQSLLSPLVFKALVSLKVFAGTRSA